jgi:group I intron endonuclease
MKAVPFALGFPRAFAVAGIYAIRLRSTRRLYVGSSVNIRARLGQHLSQLLANRHHAPKLQHTWNKYGQGQFEALVLEEVPRKRSLIVREQYWIDFHKAFRVGLNTRPIAEANYDVEWSPAQNKKRQSSNVKTWADPKLRKQLSDRFSGVQRGTRTAKTAPRRSRSLKKAHRENPEWAESISRRGRETWADPKKRESRIQNMKKGKRVPAVRKALLQQLAAVRGSPRWLVGVRAAAARRKGITRPPDSISHEAARLYATGLSCRMIGRQLGIDHKGITARLRQLGIEIVPRYRRGEAVHFAKLTEKSVRAMRRALERGVRQSDLARRYGVRPSVLSEIARGVSWRHVV